jgi:hypothetical protein
MAPLIPLRRRMIEDMRIRNMSPATQQSYIIPTLIDQNPCAHWRRPSDMMRRDLWMRVFQA